MDLFIDGLEDAELFIEVEFMALASISVYEECTDAA